MHTRVWVVTALLVSACGAGDQSSQPDARSVDSPNPDAPIPGKFSAQVTYPVGPNPFPIAIADVDGDGKPDLVSVANGGGSANNVAILRNNGGGTFAAATYEPPTGCCTVVIADVNGDMKPDVIDARAVHLNNGNGTLGQPALHAIASSVAVGDLNGDGLLDLAGSSYDANTSTHLLAVQLGVGNGTFAPLAGYPATGDTASAGTGVAIGDLNGDSKADIARVNFSDSTSTFYNSVSVYMNNGDGTFATEVPYTTGGGPTSVAFGDLDNDGDLDMAVSSRNSNGVSVLLNDGNGTFAPRTTFPIIPLSAPSFSYQVSIGDLNGDGKLDLAATSAQTDTVNVLLNDGAGSFGSAVHYPARMDTTSVASGDVNADGRPDLVATNRLDNTVSVFLWVP